VPWLEVFNVAGVLPSCIYSGFAVARAMAVFLYSTCLDSAAHGAPLYQPIDSMCQYNFDSHHIQFPVNFIYRELKRFYANAHYTCTMSWISSDSPFAYTAEQREATGSQLDSLPDQ
jgi:hypothetical protein